MQTPPKQSQLTGPRLLRMSLGALKHHFVSSLLQLATVAATAAFLTFVLGRIIIEQAGRQAGLASGAAQGRMEQLLWMLAIALLVCTISNITSMLMSVTKRFREIGTMKCLGAFDRSILVLFLVEAVILGGAGALGGALLGFFINLGAAASAYDGQLLTLALTGRFALASLVTVGTVGVLSFVGAAYPARVAGRMMPIEAMRST